MEKLTREQMITANDILIDLIDVMSLLEISKMLNYDYKYLNNIINWNFPFSRILAKKLLNMKGTLKENNNFILLKK